MTLKKAEFEHRLNWCHGDMGNHRRTILSSFYRILHITPSLTYFSVQRMREGTLVQAEVGERLNPFALCNRKASPWNCWSKQMFSVCTGFKRYQQDLLLLSYVMPWGTWLPGIQGIVLWKGEHFLLLLLVWCLQEITSSKSSHAVCKAKNYSGKLKG